MKKKILGVLLCIFCLTGCGIKPEIQDIEVEAGTEISTNLSDYIDTSKFEDASLDVSNVDINVPGEYECTVSYKNKDYNFIVHVIDTAPPTAERTDDYIICQPGTLTAADYITNANDITDTKIGFLSFEKRDDLRVMTNDEIAEDAIKTEETEIFTDDMSFETEKEVSEEGIYDVKIAVRDTSGNMDVFGYSFYIDGTGPNLPEHEDETMEINDANGEFLLDLSNYYCSDNFDDIDTMAETANVDYETLNYSLNKEGKPTEDIKITISAEDRAGNQNKQSWVITTVNNYDFVSEMGKIVADAAGLTETVTVQDTSNDGFHRETAEAAFAMVNQKRSENGANALTWNESLYNLACERAKEIVQNYSHTRLDGSDVNSSIFALGFTGSGENICRYGNSVNETVDAWMNSSGHRQNMLNSKWTYGAVAHYVCNGKNYYVNLFSK